MSVKQMSLVWDLDVEPNKKIVLLAYADHADDDGDNVYPSLARIAHKTGYSKDQVRRISRALVDDNLMVLVKKGVGRGNPHRYKLTLEKGSMLPSFKSREKVASEPVKGSIAMPPEPSIENHQYSRRDAGASKKPNYFKDFCDDMSKVGLTVDDDHRKTIPKNLTRLIEKRDATPSDMVQVIWKMVEARARPERPYELSPQKALDQVRGIKPALSLVQPEPTAVSPECVISALGNYTRDGITDLQKFAPLARQWDFTLTEKPPWEVFRELGGNDEERGRNLGRVRSVSLRAVRSVG